MIRIYPTTTFSFQKINEQNDVEQSIYHVVTLTEYLHDQDIELFYVKEIAISNDHHTITVDPKEASTIYLGYIDNPRDLTLIFRKDNTGESWLSSIKEVNVSYKDNLPNWEDDDVF